MVKYKMIFKNEDGENILSCPECGDIFLHQYTTEVFEREEDELEGYHVTVNNERGVTIKKGLDGNPSSRRSGLKIYLRCEICGRTSILSIYQHKGQTYLKII